MLIRLRSRDGLERIQVSDQATVEELRRQITDSLNIPWCTLSKDPKLLTSKDAAAFTDMAKQRAKLRSLGVQHGDLVYMHYPFERSVEPSVKPSVFGNRGFGAKMTVDDLLAKQTRIERQESPHCASISFDRHAANMFQQYVLGALAFSIKRGGLLYGAVDDEGNVLVNAIYEPPQEGSADHLQLERSTEEEKRADYIAQILGWSKVGWIFTQSAKEREFIMSVEEVCQIAALQDELGEKAATGVVSMSPEGDVHFEAFQVSDQCVRLYKDGWFQDQEKASGVSTLRDPKEPKKTDPVIVAGKDVGEVDIDYFLIPVNIRDHEGPLSSNFPIENRLLAQGAAELKQYLQRYSGKSYVERLSDFHLLLYLSKQPNFDLQEDIAFLVEAVKHKAVIPEGYSLIIDSLSMS